MLNLTIDEIVEVTKGELLGNPPQKGFFEVSTDSRTIKPDSLFIALKGDKFDGHNFINAASERGATGVVVSEGLNNKQEIIGNKQQCLIQVRDTLTALQELAHFYKSKMKLRTIAITGSNGKSTTKEMVASVCSQRLRVLKTEGNNNNLIGLPLTLLKLQPEHQVDVLELGMNKKGEIRRLTEISEPDYGIITNINMSHIEFFKSVDEIAEAKAELFQTMNKKAIAILNADDFYFSKLKRFVKGSLITVGIKNKADVMAMDIKSKNGKTYFTLRTSTGEIPIYLPLVGEFNVINALYAAAIGTRYYSNLDIIRVGLEKVKDMPMRMNITSIGNKINVINDAYNANPASMKEAIKVLKEINPDSRHIAIIGDMLELGDWTENAHRDIGNYIAKFNLSYLFTLGSAAQILAQEAIRQGMNKDSVFICEDHGDIAQRLKDIVREGDWLLVKGSRRMAMEKVINALSSTLSLT
ncbi:MAG: UDP-N-acetylmuramoyl-tripeptide--D-alanyl-D-alanine ligase [bacterium]